MCLKLERNQQKIVKAHVINENYINYFPLFTFAHASLERAHTAHVTSRTTNVLSFPLKVTPSLSLGSTRKVVKREREQHLWWEWFRLERTFLWQVSSTSANCALKFFYVCQIGWAGELVCVLSFPEGFKRFSFSEKINKISKGNS